MTVYNKLQQVQASLKVPKSQYNKFGGYSYRSNEDILEAVKPFLTSVGATLIVGDEIVEISGRFYVKATAIFTDIEDGSSVTNTAYAREADTKKGMDESQITGSASSYARKYCLNGLFCLDDVKDADTMDNSGDSKRESEPAKKQPAKQPLADNSPDNKTIGELGGSYIPSLRDEMEKKAVSEDKILTRYKVKELSDLTLKQWKDAMKSLEHTKPPMNPPEDDPLLPWNQGTAKAEPKKKSKKDQADELYKKALENTQFK